MFQIVLLSTWHWLTHVILTVAYDIGINSTPNFTDGETGTETVGNVLKSHALGSNWANVWIQAVWIQRQPLSLTMPALNDQQSSVPDLKELKALWERQTVSKIF